MILKRRVKRWLYLKLSLEVFQGPEIKVTLEPAKTKVLLTKKFKN